MHQGDRIIIFFFLISIFLFGLQEINAESINSTSDSTSAITVPENSHSESQLPSAFNGNSFRYSSFNDCHRTSVLSSFLGKELPDNCSYTWIGDCSLLFILSKGYS